MGSYSQAFLVPLDETLHRIVSFLPRLAVAVVLFILFYGVAALARRLVSQSLKRVSHIPWAVRVLIARMTYLGMMLIGLLTALAAINVNVTTVLASLGVAGFALGFALKDILENFIAGILLLFARPFEVNDQVMLGNFEGIVYDIQIRTTTLKTYTNDLVLIPNSSVFTNPVINHTRLGRRLYKVVFDTSLSADSDVVRREAMRAVRDSPDVMADPEPSVRIRSIDSGNDVLGWEAFFSAEPTKAVEVKTISEALHRIKQYLYDAGVPTPTATSATILQRKQPNQWNRNGAAENGNGDPAEDRAAAQ